jgi:pimeloyl-ACP methyl ester carboxylesterase
MWESLGTSHRQDRVLHGAAKVVNVIVGLIAIPLWLLSQKLTGPLRRLLVRRAARHRELLPVPEPTERSMDALWEDLQRIPHRLRPTGRGHELRKGLADVAPFVFSQHREIANIGYSYPAQFSDVVFDGADGVKIAASMATHEVPRPGLVVVHGLFSSRRFDYVRDVAVTAFYDWGFNVAAIDLRSFGLTELISAAPNTAGWKEGGDIVGAARELKARGSTTVGAWGVSLGGSSVVNASYTDGAEEALDGGVLAVSPPAVPKRAAERLSRDLHWRHPAYAINRTFRAMLESRVRSGRWPVAIEKLVDAIEHLSAPYYELGADEIWERSAAKNGIAEAKVPLLILHPEDDKIVKVDEARELAEAAAGNDNVRVWILPGGSHGILDVVDRTWTYAVYRKFFECWADYALPPGAELVYSRDPTGNVEQVG